MSLLWVVAVVLILVGMAGTVLPALPGTPLVFVGLLLAAWADGFTKVGWFTLVLLALLTAASLGIDFFASSLGAKKVGASRLAIAGSVLGGLVGFFFGLPGLFLGPFVGAALGEYISLRSLKRAGKVGLATWLGILFGTAAKIALAFTMLGLFIFAYVV
ncbi:MAG TPA: DUF456 family protein [Thermoanaerobaculia bacterium]|jgi:uncharacterized protein YqgC (DUF456 family)|nr:DUF456 family protein [Thermoanaerobaculia bacterium]